SSSAKSKPSAAHSNRRSSKNSASSPPAIRKRLKTLLQNALGSFVHLAIGPSSGSVCCSKMPLPTPSMPTKSSLARPDGMRSWDGSHLVGQDRALQVDVPLRLFAVL